MARHDDNQHCGKIQKKWRTLMSIQFVLANKVNAGQLASSLIYEIMSQRPTGMPMLFGTSTGTSPVTTYHELKKFRFSQKQAQNLTIFQQDTYVGQNLNGIEGLDYKGEIQKSLLNPCFTDRNLDPPFFIPDGESNNLDMAVANHIGLFNKSRPVNGLYVHLLGIGQNGHIGFNEPGTPFDAPTHVVELTPQTIQQNAGYYFGGDTTKVPTKAITTGLGELGQMDLAIMLAFGAAKADALYRAFIEGPSEEVPASMLAAKSIKTIVFCDMDAARKIYDIYLTNVFNRNSKQFPCFAQEFDPAKIAQEFLKSFK